MNTANTKLQIEARVPPQSLLYAPSRQSGRLVVVISDVLGEGELAGRIWSLAQGHGLGVLLFGICPTEAEQAELSRRLATIAAFLRVQNTAVDFKVKQGRDWLQQLRTTVNPDDVIACYVEDRPGILRRPLSDVLARSLAVPIRDLSEYHSTKSSASARLKQAGAWLGSVAIIAGFLLWQVRLVNILQGGTQTAALLLLLIPEVGSILLWNSLLG